MALSYAQLKRGETDTKSSKTAGYAQLKKSISPDVIEQTKARLAQRDELQRRQDLFKNAQIEAENARIEAEKAANAPLAKAGEFIYGGGLKELGKDVARGVLRTGQTLADVGIKLLPGASLVKAKGIGEVNYPGLGKVESPISAMERKANEGTLTGKEMAGYLGDSALEVATTVVAPARMFKFLKGAGVLKTMLKGGLEGATIGAGFGATTGLEEGKTAPEIAQQTVTGAGVGLGLGLGLPGGTAAVKGLAGAVTKAVDKVALRTTVKGIEKKLGKLGIDEITMVNQGLKSGAKEDDILKGLEQVRKEAEIATEAPKLAPEATKAETGVEVPKTPETTVEPQITPKKTEIKTESPIAKKVNTMLDEASKIDENLPVTTFKKQFSKAEKKINKDPQAAYNEAVWGKESDDTKSALQLSLLENAKNKGDNQAIGELGTAMARHGRKSGQEVSMFRALYEQDPMNKLLVDTARAKLSNIEARFPKLLKKMFKGEEDDVISASRKAIEKKSKLPVRDAQSIIDGFICK